MSHCYDLKLPNCCLQCKKNNYLKQNRLYVMIRCPPISLSHRLTAAPQQRRSIDSCRRCIPAVYRYLLPAPQLSSRQRDLKRGSTKSSHRRHSLRSRVYAMVRCPSVCLSQHGLTTANALLHVCCCGPGTQDISSSRGGR